MILFQFINTRVEPIWSTPENPIEADGETHLTLEQAAERTGLPPTELRRQWEATYGALIPDVDVDGQNAAPARPGRAIRTNLTLPQQLALEHTLRYPELNEEQFELFDAIRQSQGLPRFCRALHPYVRVIQGRPVLEIHTTIHHLRAIAQAQPSYDGEDAVEYCGPDEVWKTLWLNPEPPVAARARVHRHQHGRRVSFEQIARWAAYAPYLVDDNGDLTLPEAWEKRKPEQLGKCAVALALRAAFGTAMKGLYTHDEMDQARAAAAERRQTRPRPLAEGSQLRRQPEQFVESQLDVFDLVDDPPQNEAEFYRRMNDLIPEAHVCQAKIDAYRRKWRAQHLSNRRAWYAAVIAAERGMASAN